jgi:methylamine dehydrogenase accessory protein MauD
VLLIASNFLLFAVLAVLVLVVVSLARQIGVMHERTSPAGDLLETTVRSNAEPTELPEINLLTLLGDRVSLNELARDDLVLLFVAPQCQVCKPLIATFGDFARSVDPTPARFVTAASPPQAAEMAHTHNQDSHHWLLSERLAFELGVQETPWLLAISEGRVNVNQKISNRRQLNRVLDSFRPADTGRQPSEPSETRARLKGETHVVV